MRWFMRPEPHPWREGIQVYRAYREDGSPLYMARRSPEELRADVRTLRPDTQEIAPPQQ